MLNNLARRIRAFFQKSELDRDLDEEVRFHLEREIEENVRRGMNPEEARHQAMADFGGVERIKEECRDERGVRLVEDLWQDLRYGARALGKNPGFAGTAIVTLALGLGANTAVFSVVNGVLLKPLPFHEPEQLAIVQEARTSDDGYGISYPNFLDLRTHIASFERIAVFNSTYKFGRSIASIKR